MISAKQNVDISGMRPELLFGLWALQNLFFLYLDQHLDFCVTSMLDGEHSKGSLHKCGLASDIRSRGISSETKSDILKDFNFKLGHLFDLILEDEGGPNEHFHLEYDPKNPPSHAVAKSV